MRLWKPVRGSLCRRHQYQSRGTGPRVWEDYAERPAQSEMQNWSMKNGPATILRGPPHPQDNGSHCLQPYRHYLQVSLLTNRTRNGINLPTVMVQYGLQWPSTSLPLYGATRGDSRPYQEFAGGFEGRGYVQEKFSKVTKLDKGSCK